MNNVDTKRASETVYQHVEMWKNAKKIVKCGGNNVTKLYIPCINIFLYYNSITGGLFLGRHICPNLFVVLMGMGGRRE